MIPSAGYSAEVDDRGPSSLEVKFEGQGEGGRETKVEARCVGGEPRFRVETDDGDDGEGADS
jgi:hypothetical protein